MLMVMSISGQYYSFQVNSVDVSSLSDNGSHFIVVVSVLRGVLSNDSRLIIPGICLDDTYSNYMQNIAVSLAV